MATHEELISELPRLDKLSNAARLKHARKRRSKQLKRYQEYIRQERAQAVISGSSSSSMKKRTSSKVTFEEGSILNDMVSRNELIEVRQMLERGIDPNISNADGLTPLHKCCIDNTVELARILLEYGADLNARDIEGWTPLHAASATGNLQMINLLLDEGASLTSINLDDKMPIDVAADSDIRYILNQRMLEAGYTEDVLEYIRVSVPKNMLADLKDSVRQGRSLNLQDKYGATALHVAAANGYTEVLEFLLSQDNMNLDVQDTEGWTPFHAAVCWEQQEVMKQLAKNGANMDIKNLHGETAYAIAEQPEIREYILQLKTEFGKAADRVAEERDAEESGELGPRTRRLSVRRMRQAEKDNMMKDSIKEEAMLRRESMVRQDRDRGIVKQDNEIMGMGDEEGAVELTSVRKLTTGSSIEDAPEPSSPISPISSSGDGIAEQSNATVDTEVSMGKTPDDSTEVTKDEKREGGEGEGEGEAGEAESTREQNGKKESQDQEGQLKQRVLQRPESLEIDEQLAPETSNRNPRKSVLRKTDPTPIHAGPTYTCTSPVGEPYDSSGHKRQAAGRECCSVM